MTLGNMRADRRTVYGRLSLANVSALSLAILARMMRRPFLAPQYRSHGPVRHQVPIATFLSRCELHHIQTNIEGQ
jgi:hypothetical protein